MTDLDRRHLLTVLGAGLLTSRVGSAFAEPADFGQRLAAAEQSGKVSGLHALLVSQGGKVVIEHYGRGVDEDMTRNWGGFVTFGPEVLHDLRSVSKSIVGLAYGIALAQGKVPPPEANLYEQFPEYSDLAKQPGREKLTVGHVLNMSM
jgi:CubicO group peptidase (beta-lactamase class C family)